MLKVKITKKRYSFGTVIASPEVIKKLDAALKASGKKAKPRAKCARKRPVK